MPENWRKIDSISKKYSEEEALKFAYIIFRIFWNFEQKPDPFELFDAKKLQAAQTPLNNDSLGTREQRTAHI